MKGLAEAVPTTKVIGRMVEAIFHGETISQMIEAMRETVGQIFNEFSDLSVDATVNIMQSVIGNVPEGKVGPRLPEQERCCFTAKGRSGCVLAIEPMRTEEFAELLPGLEIAATLVFRGGVLTV